MQWSLVQFTFGILLIFKCILVTVYKYTAMWAFKNITAIIINVAANHQNDIYLIPASVMDVKAYL